MAHRTTLVADATMIFYSRLHIITHYCVQIRIAVFPPSLVIRPCFSDLDTVTTNIILSTAIDGEQGIRNT